MMAVKTLGISLTKCRRPMTLTGRIDFFESSASILSRLVALIQPIATTHNLTFVADTHGHSHPHTIRKNQNNVLRLETFGYTIEPAPITPMQGSAYELMGGTIRYIFPGAVVAPSAMIAFTDTQCRWMRRPVDVLTPRLLEYLEGYLPLRPRLA